MSKIELKVKKTPTDNKNEVMLDVEAPKDVSNKAYAIACRDISNSVDVPGFRKGKAPKGIIEKTYGTGYISQKAFEKVFYDLLFNVAIQEKIDIVDVVEISSFELLPEKPLTFKAKVELKPDVKLGEYKNLKVKVKKMVYKKDEFIKETLEKIANNMIEFKEVNRSVKEGDCVTIDFSGKFEDGSDVPGGKVENFQAVLEKGRFLPEFIDKLQGAKIGEQKEVEVTFPENYDQGFAGKKGVFNVTIHKVEEKVVPKIDDALAKKVGMDNLEMLKQKIEKQMTDMQEVNNKNEFENKLVEKIIENSDFEISERMVSREIDYLLTNVKQQCVQSGMNWDDFKNDSRNEEMIARAQNVAKKRIAIDLILNAVVKAENISTTPLEIENEVKNRVAQDPERMKGMENDQRFRSAVQLSVLRNKALDFLVSSNEPQWEKEVTVIGKEDTHDHTHDHKEKKSAKSKK